MDDGSTDGTSEGINEKFPEVNIIKGDGNLYWAGGMRLAWEKAMGNPVEYDAYLLLNDDVILNKVFFIDIIKTHDFCINNYGRSGIYISSTQDPDTLQISYGGFLLRKKMFSVKQLMITPGEVPKACSFGCANIMLVTKSVIEKIGVFDSRFIHGIADYDYTLTANTKKIPVLVCPGYGGFCKDDHEVDWMPSGNPLKKRIEYLYSPKGLQYKQRIYYLKKHFKRQFPYYFIMLWLKTLFPVIWEKKKEKYIK